MSLQNPEHETPGVSPHATNFIRNILDEDLATGKHQTVVTRFPPESPTATCTSGMPSRSA